MSSYPKKKSEGWSLNGKRPILIRSLHGRIEFSLQKFKREGEKCTFFDCLSEFGHQSYISERLREYACWLSLNQSYEKVEQILDRQCFCEILSSQKIADLVLDKAIEISDKQSATVTQYRETELPSITSDIDLYAEKKSSQYNEDELIVFEDGILVKGQKYHRKSANRAAPSNKGKRKRPVTDIALLPNKDGTKTYLIGGVGENAVQLDKVMQTHVKQQFSTIQNPLKLVCITDGASQIRTRYIKAFGLEPIRILDWYHLKKKVNELCMMICFGKEKKKQAVKDILRLLWIGEHQKAVDYLKTKVEIRNQKKHTELVNYLEKHSKAIINYELRKAKGRTIGSGAIEITVKQAVAMRQKKKGMSWIPKGSTALAILTVQQMNGNWDNLWAFNTNST